MIRTYEESALITADGPFSGELIKATGALCPDGIRRNAYPSADGIADTFFSIPAYVNVGKLRVYGYVTVETIAGYSVDMPDDPATVKFVPYLYRSHWQAVYSPLEVWAILAQQAIGSDVAAYVPSSYVDTESEHDYRVAQIRAAQAKGN